MSVLVKNMEMPKDCRECRLMEYHSHLGETWCAPAVGLLAVNFKPIPFDGRPDWCPLVELPKKHGRLIDADAFNLRVRLAVVSAEDELSEEFMDGVLTVLIKMKTEKTVIEAEGVDE